MYTYDWTELEIHKKKCVKKQASSWKKNVISHVFSKYRSILFENIYFYVSNIWFMIQIFLKWPTTKKDLICILLFPCISLDETLNFKRLYIDNSNLLNEKVYPFQKHLYFIKKYKKKQYQC
jgi:hypothetical protein